jgi:hypothetical protein
MATSLKYISMATAVWGVNQKGMALAFRFISYRINIFLILSTACGSLSTYPQKN